MEFEVQSSKFLRMKRVAPKFVSRLLTAEQKQRRMEVCHELKELLQTNENSLVRSGDESWCYGYGPEAKQQSKSVDDFKFP